MLDPREQDVLISIVEHYIQSALPVGSRTVSKNSQLGLSPASIRNTMADLSDKGYLDQPHASAGRIPTARAFRLYLDTTLKPRPLPPEQQQLIVRHLESSGLEVAPVLTQATKLLSQLSNQISMVLAPNRADVRWREIDFSLVKPRLVLAVLVLEGGIVQNRLLEVDEDLKPEDLEKFRNYLNTHYAGMTLAEARAQVLMELTGAKRRLSSLYRKALRLARHAVEGVEQRDVFVDGTMNIFDHSEFTDLGRMREILSLVEERSQLLELLDKAITAEQGARVTLGDEHDQLTGCSLVSSSYGADRPLGLVTVIGPLRMDYANVVPAVDTIARALTHVLKERF